TQVVNEFRKEVQASSTSKYSLEGTQDVTKSDGGSGYAAERYQEAFSQSKYPDLNQIDDYHIKQSNNITFAWKMNEFEGNIQCAINEGDNDKFDLLVDKFESTLEDEKEIKRVSDFRTYIVNHWERIFDWRNLVEDAPKDARSLGCIES